MPGIFSLEEEQQEEREDLEQLEEELQDAIDTIEDLLPPNIAQHMLGNSNYYV